MPTVVDRHESMVFGQARNASVLSDMRGTHSARRTAPLGFQVRPTPRSIAGTAYPSHKSLAFT